MQSTGLLLGFVELPCNLAQSNLETIKNTNKDDTTEMKAFRVRVAHLGHLERPEDQTVHYR